MRWLELRTSPLCLLMVVMGCAQGGDERPALTRLLGLGTPAVETQSEEDSVTYSERFVADDSLREAHMMAPNERALEKQTKRDANLSPRTQAHANGAPSAIVDESARSNRMLGGAFGKGGFGLRGAGTGGGGGGVGFGNLVGDLGAGGLGSKGSSGVPHGGLGQVDSIGGKLNVAMAGAGATGVGGGSAAPNSPDAWPAPGRIAGRSGRKKSNAPHVSAGADVDDDEKDGEEDAFPSSSALAPQVVQRVIRQRQRGILYCYEKALTRAPTLAGHVHVRFDVPGDGRVERATIQRSTLNSTAAEACMLRNLRRWRFPAHGGRPITLTHTFSLSPSKSASPPPVIAPGADPLAKVRLERPDAFMPRMAYFENTYLGGNAAYVERLRALDAHFGPDQRPYHQAHLEAPTLDAPTDAGLAITAALDRAWVDEPQRVVLQIGIQGSRRYGWRRPPLDVALVVDPSVMAPDGPGALTDALTALVRRLGPQDRLGVIIATESPRVLADLDDVDSHRLRLARQLESGAQSTESTPMGVHRALTLAGTRLRAAANEHARIPGTQLVLLLTRGERPETVSAARDAVHRLTVQGAVTSVISMDGRGDWWQVANAGHGNLHRNGDDLSQVIEKELDSVSRVIARLLRLNIKLAPNVEAIRVIGSRVLDDREVAQVKAREESTDRNLSRTLGVAADRGDDDDGIQTVIPYFYGGDSHLILVELWVDKPGPVADITLKFKDMVKLENATARTSAWIPNTPRSESPTVRAVRTSLFGFYLAEALEAAGDAVRRGRTQRALRILDGVANHAQRGDAPMVAQLRRMVTNGVDRDHLAEALHMAHERRIGQSAVH